MNILQNIIWRIDCLFNIYEKTEKLRHKQWNKNTNNYVFCVICGEMLKAKDCKWCPEECGWWKIKDIYSTKWICHKCNGHHETNFVRIDDLSQAEIKRLLDNKTLPSWFRNEIDF